jgi:RNA polymerase sigma-70 factor, ECF subfamily
MFSRMPPSANTPEENIIGMITKNQGSLRAYIYTLLPNPALVDDVLQETNLVIWRKACEYDPARPFMPWACRIALFQVKAARRDNSRDLHVFDSELVDILAAEAEVASDSTGELDIALRDCLAELPDEKRQLILFRYYPDSSVQDLADSRNTTPGALSVELHRIRRSLESCILGKLKQATP